MDPQPALAEKSQYVSGGFPEQQLHRPFDSAARQVRRVPHDGGPQRLRTQAHESEREPDNDTAAEMAAAAG